MSDARSTKWQARLAAVLLAGATLALSISPASAQNKKRSWEIFIYF
jgi:hypothetical protein